MFIPAKKASEIKKKKYILKEKTVYYIFFQLLKVNSSSFAEASSLKEDGNNIALI